MKNFLIGLLILCLVGGGVYWGVKYGFKFPNIEWSKFNPFGNSKLEKENERLSEKIEELESKSDSLQPLIKKYQLQTDSLQKIDSLIQIEISDIRKKNIILERRLSQSKDSVSKYRNNWKKSVKKYEDMKKHQKVPTNQQALDFFKKY